MSSFFGGNSTEPIVHWKAEPTERGTATILTSCIITIFLCIWTAVHMNIPSNQDHTWHKAFWRRVGWLMLGLIAPEIVLYTSWYQREVASETLHSVREALGQDPPPTAKERLRQMFDKIKSWFTSNEDEKTAYSPVRSSAIENEWTMTHAFFASMGGFSCNTKGTSLEYFPRATVLTFNSVGIKALARDKPHVLDISKQEIMDKSKAGGLTKFIACVQALWFGVQCVNRLAQGHPISLLELNTFAHAACALLIYVMWWNKPQDVSIGKTTRGQDAVELLDWLWDQGLNRKWAQRQKLIESIRQSYLDLGYLEPLLGWDRADVTYGDMFYQPQFRKDGSIKTRLRRSKKAEMHRGNQPLYDPDILTQLKANVTELRNDVDSLSTDERKLLGKKTDRPFSVNTTETNSLFVQTRIADWPTYLGGDEGYRWRAWLFFLSAEFGYGGIHALAWNAHFDSRVELILWRASSVSVMGLGVVIIAVAGVLYTWDNYVYEDMEGDGYLKKFCRFVSDSITVIEFLVLAIYFGARGYLVVQAFLSLFYSPEGIYQVPAWTAYMPHIN